MKIIAFYSSRLMKRTDDLDNAYDQLEQYGRRECLEIKGIPETKDENTDRIVINLASKMGVQMNESDISVSHRNPNPKADRSSNSTGPAIIVKFTRRNTRDQLFKSRLKLKNITTKDLGFTRSRDSRIFISESLTSPRKELYLECVRFKKSEGYKYLWTRYGKIFLRADEDSPAILIKDSLQLEDQSEIWTMLTYVYHR